MWGVEVIPLCLELCPDPRFLAVAETRTGHLEDGVAVVNLQKVAPEGAARVTSQQVSRVQCKVGDWVSGAWRTGPREGGFLSIGPSLAFVQFHFPSRHRP
jgi:hypothetical protein